MSTQDPGTGSGQYPSGGYQSSPGDVPASSETVVLPAGGGTASSGASPGSADADLGYSAGPGFAGPAAGSPDFGQTTDEPRHRASLGWNSGADIGLLVLRLVLGGTFIAHGSQKAFSAFDGPGFDGFAGTLADAGYRYSDVLSMVTGITELVAGGLVILGLFTPLAAAGLLGIMVNAIAVKWSGGFFGSGQGAGFELDLALAAMAVGLILAGPGRAALDNGRAWFRHPVAFGWICLLIGGGAGAAALLLLRN